MATERANRSAAPGGSARIDRDGAELVIRLSGHWTLDARIRGRREALAALAGDGLRSLRVEVVVAAWDGRLVAFLHRLQRTAAARGLAVTITGLPPAAGALLRLVPPTAVPAPAAMRLDPLARLGRAASSAIRTLDDAVAFVGELALALGRLVRGRADFDWRAFGWFVQRSGFDALAITGLVAVLVGMVLAFVGAGQLGRFGAEIYVANLVTLGMTREMGALMSAIVMAGRTGAAYAAELASMRLGEEVDALETLGVRVVDHLVLPRLLALAVTLPLLSLYAVFVGMVGGALSATLLFDLGLTRYLEQSRLFLDGGDFLAGLGKAAVYAWLVAFAGCWRGMRAPRTAAGVGDAATSAVVLALVLIVCGDAVMTVIYHVLDI